MEKGVWKDGRLNEAKWLVKVFCTSETIGSSHMSHMFAAKNSNANNSN